MRLTRLVPMAIVPILLVACAPQEPYSAEPAPTVGMANPASVHCVQSGGRSEIRTSAGGGQYGVCLFNDGRQCEEWALFRDKQCVAPR